MTVSRRRVTAAAAILTAGALTLAGCAKGGGGGPAATGGGAATPTKSLENKAVSAITVGTAADSNGPANPVEGAKRGGTVNMIDRDDFSHLDPGRVYLNYNATASLLFTRQLTGYRQAADGSLKLVGDLATDTGTTTDGGKTWKFTLKDGLKWQDGSAITSADIKYSVERLFAPFITEGPTYLQQWLAGADYRKAYEGPYNGKSLDAIETPDDKTVVFKLKEAHPDLNFTVAMTGYGAVPKAQDTKEKYDKKPFSSGPYQIVSHITDKSMDLERNPHWDPNTDPIRNAFPDKWHMEFGLQSQQSTERFLADSGPDKTAMTFHNAVAPERVQEVLGNAEAMKRSIQGLTPFTTFYNLNSKRLTDVKVRQAIIKAWPSKQLQLISGGEINSGKIATTVMSPTVLGYEAFDLYGTLAKPNGDPEGAKKLLQEAGKPNPTVVYAYNQTPTQEKITVAIKDALGKAGFNVVAKPLNPATYYDAIGPVDNKYDIYWTGWAADWPTGQTAIQPLFDSRLIADNSTNYSHFSNPEVDAAIDAANKITDAAEAGKAWAALDKKIMEQAPIVPEYYQTYFGLYGSGLGGVEFSLVQGEQSPLNVYVK
ncbi:ABC transporter [Sphaerisporangium krabiense]|uniref:Peptide/nickel transport system substrate-binding protein n=1 Tax=Sphaerisporangium krabiense TaxID=763782 RepID=A0A7W9DSL2_9ACTN|nr:ABC transporter substrate-binding protein [Sphaerisporangium krabiense]MBB5629259.1 peptide/nickel transport system substrate-binding protein [Sphaerisporangium krabiense]GII67032.1 ABC transporter [Sphaerisporangium krabiense]